MPHGVVDDLPLAHRAKYQGIAAALQIVPVERSRGRGDSTAALLVTPALYKGAGCRIRRGRRKEWSLPQLMGHVGRDFAGAAAIIANEGQRFGIAYEGEKIPMATEDGSRAIALPWIREMHRLRQDDDGNVAITRDQ